MRMLTKVQWLAVVAALLVVFNACDRKITQVAQQEPLSCFECHSDVDTRLIANSKQWSNSAHASGITTSHNNASCSGCHTSEGFKDRISGAGSGDYPNATVIHCFTCHAPHSNGDFTLRVTQAQTLENGVSRDINLGNICASCHHARRDVNTYVSGTVNLSSHWGPHHGVQGDMLFGSNGYQYVGYTYGDNMGHRTATADGCLDCHLRTTSNFVVGGHSFNMRAVVATEFETGEHQDFTEILNTAACEPCHGSLSDFNFSNVQDSVDVLMDSLQTILVNAGMVDTTAHPISGVSISADSAGALWNFLMAHEDRSHGVHNAKYIMGLLESGILYMQGSLPQPTSPGPMTVMRYGDMENPREGR